MLSKFKIFLILLFATLFFVKPVLAGCDRNLFSQYSAYEPLFDTCGKSIDVNGKEVNECCNTNPAALPGQKCDGTGARCWLPYSEKKEAGCESTYIAYGPTDIGGRCDTCCQQDPNRTFDCLWRSIPSLPVTCDKVKNFALKTKPRTYCKPPEWYYVSADNRCYRVVKSGWSQNLTGCQPPFPGAPPPKGVATAIGCIPTSDLVLTGGFFLKWAFGAAGGIILIMLIITGYSFMTSSGNPEKLQAVKENLVSILSGLILLGFSLVLLKAVGADILGLPGF